MTKWNGDLQCTAYVSGTIENEATSSGEIEPVMESDDFVESEGTVMDLNAGSLPEYQEASAEQRRFLQKVLLQTKLWKMDSLKHYASGSSLGEMENPGEPQFPGRKNIQPGVILCLLKRSHLKEHLHLTVIMALWQNWMIIQLRRQAWGLRIDTMETDFGGGIGNKSQGDGQKYIFRRKR